MGSDLSFAIGTVLWDARALGVYPDRTRQDTPPVSCVLLEPNDAEQNELRMFMTSPELVMQVVVRKMEAAAA